MRIGNATSFAWSINSYSYALRYGSATTESHIPNLSWFFPLLILISAEIRVPVTRPYGFGHSMT